MSNIAFLGTGLLGGAFAEAAAKRGDTVTEWNRSPNNFLDLKQFGVIASANPAEAVRNASRIHLVLKDDAVVEEVLVAARSDCCRDLHKTFITANAPTTPAARR